MKEMETEHAEMICEDCKFEGGEIDFIVALDPEDKSVYWKSKCPSCGLIIEQKEDSTKRYYE